MKKILLGMGLVLLMASCSDNYTDWANPQSNAQEDAKTVNLTVNPASAIDFATLTADSVQLFVPTVKAENGSTSSFTTLLYNADKSATQTIVANEKGIVSSAELEAAVVKLYGRRPSARTIPLDVTGYTLINGQSIKNFGTTTATATPEAPVIESAYYLVGGINSWDNTNTDYEVVNSGADVYEDPVFTITLSAAQVEQGFEFKLNSKSGLGTWDKCYTATTDGTAGKIADGNAGDNLKVDFVDGAKYYKLEFNMLDQTYKVTTMSDPELFLTGDHYGWGSTWKPLIPVYDTADTFWTIVYLHSGEQFKFAPEAGWGNDFGMQATIVDETNAGVYDSGGNITITNAGWYLVKVVTGAKPIVSFLKPNVYLMGDTAGEWNIGDTHLFTVPTTEDGDFVSPAFAKTAEVRMCVSIGTDWWKTECIVNASGKIDYRGKGGDQTPVTVTAGQKAYLNFATGTGSYK
ncbi:MAG: DUF5115 domain-containing protein [Bacteroidota bacterium]|nr:DUF5115 domain-containing protein [Bacteroidota bacterium]